MRPCIWICVGIAVGLPLLTGCPLLYALVLQAEHEAALARVAEEPCGDSACDRDAWRVVYAYTNAVSQLWPAHSTPSAPLTFDSDQDLVSASADRNSGRMALITNHGRLFTGAPFEPGQADVPLTEVVIAAPAFGVAWSNAGDRLALVVRADDGAHRVVLLDESFEVAVEWPVELADLGPPPLPRLWRFVMSWSADDARIAITHDPSRGATYPDGLILNAADGSTIDFPVYRAYFIGADRLVADPGGDTKLYRLSGSSVESQGRIDGSLGTHASDPVTGVFASAEEPLPIYGSPVGLRTVDGGGDIVSGLGAGGYAADSVMLLPATTP